MDLTSWDSDYLFEGRYVTELRNNKNGQASDGVNFVELDGDANSSISQALSTKAQSSYLLTFDFANRIDTSIDTNGLAWSFDGGLTMNELPVYNDYVWHHFSIIVTASSESSALLFRAFGTSDRFGSSLDNIKVLPLPNIPLKQ